MTKFSELRKTYVTSIIAGLHNDFHANLLNAAFQNLENGGQLAFNNFAYVLREFLRHFLHEAAPDSEVKKCVWYVPAKTSSTGITRGHRAKYAIQGGLSDRFLEKKLGIEIEPALDDLRSTDKILNKYTHIELGTFDISRTETYRKVEECLKAVSTHISLVNECRYQVKEAVHESIDRKLVDQIVMHGVDELYDIATHGRVESHWIDNIVVNDISSNSVQLSISGSLDVSLQYGSNSDVRNDSGILTSTSLSFKSEIELELVAPLGKVGTVNEFSVCTDDIYETEHIENHKKSLRSLCSLSQEIFDKVYCTLRRKL